MLHGIVQKVRIWITVYVNVTWYNKKVRVVITVYVIVTWYYYKKVWSCNNCLCNCYMVLYKKVRRWIIVYVNVTWCNKKVRVVILVYANVTWYCRRCELNNCLCKCYMVL
jgi:hypothetical protein